MNDPAQVASALARANEIRIARAELKHRIFNRETTVAGVLLNNPQEAASMTVYHLLRAQRGWGPDKAGRFLRLLPMSESRRVGDLTDRERGRITSRLDGSAAMWWEAA